jgi:hypothetical protein
VLIQIPSVCSAPYQVVSPDFIVSQSTWGLVLQWIALPSGKGDGLIEQAP